ncbi:MAG: tetratricopeptide repeat protein [Deltaproteobacteria bacterium]|nr:tetratricopeptide repeat protein [Candidatus Zymogenaceae bacterium]
MPVTATEVKSNNMRVFIASMIIVALILLPGYMIHSLVKNGKARNSWERYLEYTGVGNDIMGLVAVTEAIDIDGRNAEYYSARAAILNEMEEYNEALLDANEALRLDPTLNEAYYNRGMARLGLGQYDNAIAEFETVLGSDPVHTGAIYGRGEAYFMLELYNKALEDLEKACNLGIPEACDRIDEILEIRGG